jgi:hypothetical protein
LSDNEYRPINEPEEDVDSNVFNETLLNFPDEDSDEVELNERVNNIM